MRYLAKRLKYSAQYLGAKAAQTAIRAVPIDAARNAAAAIGRKIVRARRPACLIENNLRWVRPELDEAARRRIAADVGDNFGRLLVEYAHMTALAGDAQRRRAEGVEILRDAVARGCGVILASAHIGNWEAIRLAAREAGVEVGIIYRAFNNPLFDRNAQGLVAQAGTPVLHKGRQGLRAMLEHLRTGGAILVLVDQRISSGEALPFLGRDALTATAIAGMARKLGAALLPAVALRDASGHGFDIRFEPDIARDSDIETMRALNDRVSDWIREAPGQWFWLHRRWRARSGQGFLGDEAQVPSPRD